MIAFLKAWRAIRAVEYKKNIKNHSIILTGMMGSGKTTLGKSLAKMTGLPFIDTDKALEKLSGMSVASFFEEKGEKAFRLLEQDLIKYFLKIGSPKILALGGGAFIHQETREYIKKNGLSVWIREDDSDELLNRVSKQEVRPLLKGEDKEKKIKKLMDERYPAYAQADITLITKGKNISDSAKELLKAVNLKYTGFEGFNDPKAKN